MGRYVSNFDTIAEFAAFSATTEFSAPHISYIKENRKISYYEVLKAKFNVTTTSQPTQIVGVYSGTVYSNYFTSIEIDDVPQPTVESGYTFSTTGEHIVKYTLSDPTNIGDYAFFNCSSMTNIVITDSVTNIGQYAFEYCYSLATCTIGSSVTNIDKAAFYRCYALTSIDIPNSVKGIVAAAFQYCTGLTNVTIGTGVTSIGGNAFSGCTSLTSVTINAATPPNLDNANAFESVNNYPIYVPSGSVATYKAATNWSGIADRIQAIP